LHTLSAAFTQGYYYFEPDIQDIQGKTMASKLGVKGIVTVTPKWITYSPQETKDSVATFDDIDEMMMQLHDHYSTSRRDKQELQLMIQDIRPLLKNYFHEQRKFEKRTLLNEIDNGQINVYVPFGYEGSLIVFSWMRKSVSDTHYYAYPVEKWEIYEDVTTNLPTPSTSNVTKPTDNESSIPEQNTRRSESPKEPVRDYDERQMPERLDRPMRGYDERQMPERLDRPMRDYDERQMPERLDRPMRDYDERQMPERLHRPMRDYDERQTPERQSTEDYRSRRFRDFDLDNMEESLDDQFEDTDENNVSGMDETKDGEDDVENDTNRDDNYAEDYDDNVVPLNESDEMNNFDDASSDYVDILENIENMEEEGEEKTGEEEEGEDAEEGEEGEDAEEGEEGEEAEEGEEGEEAEEGEEGEEAEEAEEAEEGEEEETEDVMDENIVFADMEDNAEKEPLELETKEELQNPPPLRSTDIIHRHYHYRQCMLPSQNVQTKSATPIESSLPVTTTSKCEVQVNSGYSALDSFVSWLCEDPSRQ
jgi:hypothetical protein